MKTIFLSIVVALIFCSCNKTDLFTKTISGNSGGFVQYTIRQGNNYCEGNDFKPVEISEMKFLAKFDSTAIYQTLSPENQDDINKLYGFADNNSNHHEYSARFGWRWSNGALRLFAYVYNQGIVSSKELTTINIGQEVNCSIKIIPGKYLFTVNDTTEEMPRAATTEKAKGYQLYPYFGGDETAPHEIHVWIKPVANGY